MSAPMTDVGMCDELTRIFSWPTEGDGERHAALKAEVQELRAELAESERKRAAITREFHALVMKVGGDIAAAAADVVKI